jgi:hypothetical protein
MLECWNEGSGEFNSHIEKNEVDDTKSSMFKVKGAV